MLNYFNKLATPVKVYLYNAWHSDWLDQDKPLKKYSNLSDELTTTHTMNKEELKLARINTLSYIKQCKNTYYKYTHNKLFNQQLYDSFVEESHFDSGNTAFDDDDNVRIFDKYILEYIKNRNDVMTYFQCKNIKVNTKTNLEELTDFRAKADEKDVLFIIDMTDKQIFDYCFEIQKNCCNSNETKMIVLSMVFKYQSEYIRIKLNSHRMNTEYHPYLVLENCVK